MDSFATGSNYDSSEDSEHNYSDAVVDSTSAIGFYTVHIVPTTSFCAAQRQTHMPLDVPSLLNPDEQKSISPDLSRLPGSQSDHHRADPRAEHGFDHLQW